MSKTSKMRDRLTHIADKSREEFEQKKKELEEEMNKGRTNYSKIQKGLRNNEVINDPTLAVEFEGQSPAKMKTAKSSNTLKKGPTPVASFNDKSLHDPSNFMPSGLRVSDWCFNGQLDSSPPVVKVNEVYESIRPLGRGAFGDVYLVKNIDDNKLFANKTMLAEREADMREMLREVKFLRMNRHPCIIDIHDGFITAQPRVLNIICSYCEAGDLAKVISSSRKTRTNIPETQIIKWSMQIALALHFIHEKGLIHRDLKPNNVMLADGGEIVKVADFGLALDTADTTMYHTGEAGTPVYTAPEMIKGEKYSYAADCFSFGVMLHEFMRLELPFTGNTTTDLVKAILQDEPPPVPGHYSEDLKSICVCLLEKAPSRRLGFAGLLMEPLFYTKTSGFPSGYRPKAIEERIRRSQARLLTSQIDNLMNSKNSSTATVAELVAENARVKVEMAAAADLAAAVAAEEAAAQAAEGLINGAARSPAGAGGRGGTLRSVGKPGSSSHTGATSLNSSMREGDDSADNTLSGSAKALFLEEGARNTVDSPAAVAVTATALEEDEEVIISMPSSSSAGEVVSTPVQQQRPSSSSSQTPSLPRIPSATPPAVAATSSSSSLTGSSSKETFPNLSQSNKLSSSPSDTLPSILSPKGPAPLGESDREVSAAQVTLVEKSVDDVVPAAVDRLPPLT